MLETLAGLPEERMKSIKRYQREHVKKKLKELEDVRKVHVSVFFFWNRQS
jgi:hypothetical protein